jgi:predicted metalloprotease
MRWQGGRRGGNIDDRRGMGGGTMAGGGIGVLILAAIGYIFFDIDPAITTQVASQFGGAGVSEGRAGSPTDQAGAFVDIVGSNIDDVWKTQLQGYEPPTVTLYERGTVTGCGFGQSAMGPFYCPADRHVYLDLSFWSQLETQLGASSADFARAYVIAHEYGHHVQTLMGTSQQVQAAQQRASGQAEANRYSVALELQADCYAGVWARNAATVSNGEVALEAGDLEAGMQTA